MENQLYKKRLILSVGSPAVVFSALRRKTVKALAMEGVDSSFSMVAGTECFIHRLMFVFTILFFLYQTFCFLAGRHKKVRVKAFVPAGIYVFFMLVALAFGDCYIDFIVMIGGVALAAP